ncbi:MAG: FHA domain-containing protein [Planctomycetes bacterium]|nr:FHA domain-containing protein [Planctomycetota bacterium]
MSEADVAADWVTLGVLAKRAGVLPKEAFEAQFTAPFLLELNPEEGASPDDTREYSRSDVEELSPSLSESLILYLGEGDEIVIGRQGQARCNHASVSEKHCVLRRFGTLWSISDLGSRNGTTINGHKLAPEEQLPLKFGSKLMLGEAQFLWLGAEDCFDLLQELTREPRIRPRSLGKYRAEFKSLGSADEVRKHYPGPFLVIQAPQGRTPSPGGAGEPVSTNTIALSKEQLKANVNKNVADAVFNLANHALVRVGRASVSQIHLPLGPISALHAALVREDDTWFIQDLGAKNGTYVWGERLEGRKALESGTEVTLGNIKSNFFMLEDFITYATHRDSLVSGD